MTRVYYLLLAIVFTLIGWFGNVAWHLPKSPGNPISEIKPRPLEKYSFDNLSKTEFTSAPIQLGKILKDNPKYTSYEFTLKFSPDLSTNLKTTSGLINIPKGPGPFPVIVMFRGFVDQKEYVIGEGTQHAGEFFAQNGFITIAPDFLGYGDSDHESSDIFESRFQTTVTALAILKSVNSVKNWDKTNILIWGHSNGGQIALAALEITGKAYPTVLWAPNSAKFPYSIIYYLDEASDEGKLVITKLAGFMGDYDVKNYSIRNYFDKINPETKIQLNQGLADDAVPVIWSDSLVKELKKLKMDITYIKYPGASHDLTPSWNQAVTNSLDFFKASLVGSKP